MMTLGIDPSLTCTGIVVLTGAGRVSRWQAITSKPDKTDPYSLQHRCALVTDQLMALARKADHVWLENHGFHARVGMDTRQAELVGVLKTAMWRDSVPFKLASPGEIKKFATGRGNATKLDMQNECARIGFEPGAKNHNVADAYWLASLGLAQLALA